MKLKEFVLAFGISSFLGYLYISGRLVIDGLTYPTGYDYSNLNFDFNDYTFQGILSNLYVFSNNINLFLILMIVIICIYLFIFIYKPDFNKIKNRVEVITEYKTTIFYKKIIKKESNINKFSLLLNISRRLKKTSQDLFPKYLISTYLLSIISILLIYITLLFLFKFNQQGVDMSKMNIIDNTKYILYNEKKLFKIKCGKTLCIYGNKEYTFFKKLKEEDFDTRVLNSIKSNPMSNDFYFYELSSNNINNSDKIILVQINYKKNSKINLKSNPLEFRLYVKNPFPLKNQNMIEKNCYRNIVTDETILLNNMITKKDYKGPFFIAFKIPQKNQVDFIKTFNPGISLKDLQACR
ncbi:hypothetical protein [Acinetobacter sp. YH12140]|uniref:hypothetical protein n=1 Tax=Acinetobacter sp. YH12140 TaxID=2601124 RepID=UPI0015D29781|nr:hypothetical protein [Acinetobacter sp. YH12140]